MLCIPFLFLNKRGLILKWYIPLKVFNRNDLKANLKPLQYRLFKLNSNQLLLVKGMSMNTTSENTIVAANISYNLRVQIAAVKIMPSKAPNVRLIASNTQPSILN